jgi:hypothetical protein
MLELLTVDHLFHMACELTLGICIKLFIDNGRIHWRDFVNDALFWVPGVHALAGDGLGRQIALEYAAAPALPVHAAVEDDTSEHALAAK